MNCQCIYCNPEKPSGDKQSIEHLIPQFLGGAYVDGRFRTDQVCRRCNSLLGRYVDGSFARTWWVSNWLRHAAARAYDETKPIGLPLICLGPTDLRPPSMLENEVCELWIGPLGEQIYWIRPHSEEFYWYSGGDPVAAKRFDTRAYFLFSAKPVPNHDKTWLAFRDAFCEDAVTKIMCTEVSGADPKSIGFADPDTVDQARIAYFRKRGISEEWQHLQIPYNPDYDLRFMCKLTLATGYSIFGDSFLLTPYAKELRNGVWFRGGPNPPQVQGQTQLQADDPALYKALTGLPHAVTITILPMRDSLALLLDIGNQLTWKMIIIPREQLRGDPGWKWVDRGQVIVLYRYLHSAVVLPHAAFLAHVTGRQPHPELKVLSDRLT